MAIGAGAAAIGGSIIGGLFGAAGQNSANKTNIKLARENNAFQERMSSTAYQRSTKDLEKAGLNRILALGSPSSSPSGNLARVESTTKDLGDKITQAGLLKAQIANVKASTAKTLAETNIISPKSTVMGTLDEKLNKLLNGEFNNSAKSKSVNANKLLKPLTDFGKKSKAYVETQGVSPKRRQRLQDVKKDNEGAYVLFRGNKKRLTTQQVKNYLKTGLLP